MYQWGRKDPYSFATSSEFNGDQWSETGKYPIKIYTIDGVLIYQESNGSTNTDKQPVGGVVVSSIDATSMLETIKNPNTLYGLNGPVISQTGHTKGLWDYYWTSYSRGIDGKNVGVAAQIHWHNDYLDGYTTQRLKSIYDPCPFGFRTPSGGTYNQVTVNPGWTIFSYIGGLKWNVNSLGVSWFSSVGWRSLKLCVFTDTGRFIIYKQATIAGNTNAYVFAFVSDQRIYTTYLFSSVASSSVRCIDFASPASPPDRFSPLEALLSSTRRIL